MDVLPIIVVVTFFQLVVLQQPFPNLSDVLTGGLLVIAGLILFVEGLEIGLFPLGEAMAIALARKGSLFWLLSFAFLLGFATTIAEPALIAIAEEAAKVSAGSQLIENTEKSISGFALGLRFMVALAVGISIVIGVMRIFKGWPVQYLIIGGYVIVIILTTFAPKEIIGLAFDSGGVTTSTITVPLVTALGVGLASIIKGRNPLVDGFGLIALASLLPIIFVLLYGMIMY
jgi:MFS family permease